MKRIAVIKTSPHRRGNSNILAKRFIEGASEAGNDIVEIDINDYKLNFCKGCYGTGSAKACTACGTCWQDDDANKICNMIQDCDAIVFATPIYFYSVSGQMKVLLDRTVQLYGADYRYRDIYLIATCEAGGKFAMDGAIKTLQGWMDCMPGTTLKGVVYGTSTLAPGSVKDHTSVMAEAYEMGMKV